MDEEKWNEVLKDFEELDEDMQARLVSHMLTERFSQLGRKLFGISMETVFGPCLVVVTENSKVFFPCHGPADRRVLSDTEINQLRILRSIERGEEVRVVTASEGEKVVPITEANILLLKKALIQGWSQAALWEKLGLLG